MKSLSYIFGLILFGFINNFLWSQIALQNGTGSPILSLASLIGFFACACGLLVEGYKGILNLIDPTK